MGILQYRGWSTYISIARPFQLSNFINVSVGTVGTDVAATGAGEEEEEIERERERGSRGMGGRSWKPRAA